MFLFMFNEYYDDHSFLLAKVEYSWKQYMDYLEVLCDTLNKIQYNWSLTHC